MAGSSKFWLLMRKVINSNQEPSFLAKRDAQTSRNLKETMCLIDSDWLYSGRVVAVAQFPCIPFSFLWFLVCLGVILPYGVLVLFFSGYMMYFLIKQEN